jgi:hypothetical protein
VKEVRRHATVPLSLVNGESQRIRVLNPAKGSPDSLRGPRPAPVGCGPTRVEHPFPRSLGDSRERWRSRQPVNQLFQSPKTGEDRGGTPFTTRNR